MNRKLMTTLFAFLFSVAPALAATAPLSAVDVDLYVSAMSQAANRVQHPTAEDKRVLTEADALTKTANSGKAVMMTEKQGEDMSRALLLRTQMDDVVADDRHLDTVHYDAIRDRIEEEVGELYCNPSADVPDRSLLKLRIAEIGRLMKAVRGPGGLVCASG
ncbi:MAG: hypothetical protein ACRETC_07200 [Gammaproteobacteria bacterium]